MAVLGSAGVICRMQNAERDNSLLGQRKYIHAGLSPNPIANHKPYPNPKITQRVRMESFYGCNYRKVGDIKFSADQVYCSRVLHSANCTRPARLLYVLC